MVYKPYRLNLTKAQLTKAISGKPLRLKNSQLNNGNYVILLHPSNYKLILDAVRKNKGVTIPGLSAGEIEATKASDMEGTGIFDFLKKGYNWVKNNWGTIKPVLSDVGDAVATVIPGAAPVRAQIKTLTGVGLAGVRTRGPNGKFLKKSGTGGAGLYLN